MGEREGRNKNRDVLKQVASFVSEFSFLFLFIFDFFLFNKLVCEVKREETFC